MKPVGVSALDSGGGKTLPGGRGASLPVSHHRIPPFPFPLSLASLWAKKWGYHIYLSLPCLFHFHSLAPFLALSSSTNPSRESAKCCNSVVVPQLWQLVKSGDTVPPLQKVGVHVPRTPQKWRLYLLSIIDLQNFLNAPRMSFRLYHE